MKEWDSSSLSSNVQSIIKHTRNIFQNPPKEVENLTKFTPPLLFRTQHEKDPNGWRFNPPASPLKLLPQSMHHSVKHRLVCLSGKKHGFAFSQNQFSRRVLQQQQKAAFATVIRALKIFI
eukprot:TRINITY_DN2768_c3_g1_i2.p1 TRINITY_DN2768_c3_g1~~TRINITY_DN2768_c3_g1_i2.p1  ORF type:complete len:120 (-),score=28.50 TRINITY_DN2768_c3_g1_i2:30-389(-)